MEHDEHGRRPDIDGAGWPQDSFSDALGHGRDRTDTAGSSAPLRRLGDHEPVPRQVERLPDGERDRLLVLEPGTRLEQGSVYLDLDEIETGPFKALGDQVASEEHRLVSKKDVDYELWNDLAGAGATPDVVRPDEAR